MVNTCTLCRSVVSNSIVSGGIIIFLVLFFDITGDRFKLNVSQYFLLDGKIVLTAVQFAQCPAHN